MRRRLEMILLFEEGGRAYGRREEWTFFCQSSASPRASVLFSPAARILFQTPLMTVPADAAETLDAEPEADEESR